MERWTRRQWLAGGAGAAAAAGGGAYTACGPEAASMGLAVISDALARARALLAGVPGPWPARIGITDMRGCVGRTFELIGGNFLRVLLAAQGG